MKKVETGVGKALYKVELLCIKVIPFIIALCYVANTVTSYFYQEIPIFSFIGGMSILPLIFLYLSSFVFRFCIYHRLPIYYIIVSEILAYYDMYIGIPISTKNLFLINLMIIGVFILLLVYFKFRQHEQRTSK